MMKNSRLRFTMVGTLLVKVLIKLMLMKGSIGSITVK